VGVRLLYQPSEALLGSRVLKGARLAKVFFVNKKLASWTLFPKRLVVWVTTFVLLNRLSFSPTVATNSSISRPSLVGLCPLENFDGNVVEKYGPTSSAVSPCGTSTASALSL
jgi:hypothetical protein